MRMSMGRLRSTTWFSAFARKVSIAVGRPMAFVIALGMIVAWSILGPFFGFSDFYQLIINTITTIVTFLMVFLIQCSVNERDKDVEAKLDRILVRLDQINERTSAN